MASYEITRATKIYPHRHIAVICNAHDRWTVTQARAAITKACGEDIKKYCSAADGPERFQCMREHRDDFSDSCKAAMSKMRRRGGGGQ